MGGGTRRRGDAEKTEKREVVVASEFKEAFLVDSGAATMERIEVSGQ